MVTFSTRVTLALPFRHIEILSIFSSMIMFKLKTKMTKVNWFLASHICYWSWLEISCDPKRFHIAWLLSPHTRASCHARLEPQQSWLHIDHALSYFMHNWPSLFNTSLYMCFHSNALYNILWPSMKVFISFHYIKEKLFSVKTNTHGTHQWILLGVFAPHAEINSKPLRRVLAGKLF